VPNGIFIKSTLPYFLLLPSKSAFDKYGRSTAHTKRAMEALMHLRFGAQLA
jgi:hypothetical protein